jgi:outer membrane receptor for ferrienterochelin and colicins
VIASLMTPVRFCVLVVAWGLCGGARAQASPPGSAPGATQLQRVEITAAQSSDDRKEATAAKFVLKRDDIARFGDTNLGDVLKRIPGITVSGGGSQPRDIRLRGLGGGYTQILINGEPVPAGFSLDSLSPDLIEYIEVLRSANADTSTQSIAGSINIVLQRRATSQGEKTVNVGVSLYDGLPSGTVTGQYSDRSGAVSFSVSGSANFQQDRWPSTKEVKVQDGLGQPLFEQRTNSLEKGKTFTVGLTPRVTWKVGDSESLTMDGLLQGSRFEYDAREVRTTAYGSSSARPSDVMRIVNDTTQARVSTNWKSPVGVEGRIDAKMTASIFRRVSDGRLQGFDVNQSELLFRTVDSVLQDRSLTLSGKYSLGFGDSHALGAGWDAQYSRRAEHRIQRESSMVGYPLLNLDEDYDAIVTKVAFYAQDEWNVTPRLSAYFGLRWEGLQTKTSGNSLADVKNRSGVYSPTAQVLWKIPDTKADQLRFSLSRTYRAPTARELIPRRWVVNDNSPTSPNFQGNPDLVPELALGVDVGYERYLSADGFVGVNVYGRRIKGVILQSTYLDGGTWVATPINGGNARVFGVELEAKGKLRQLVVDAPDIAIRSGLTRNWSSVDQVPGPDNRLRDQPLFTATLGADYLLPGGSFTLGGSFAFERLGRVRSSVTQSTSSDDRTTLDVYGLWIIDKGTRVRLTLANLLKPDGVVKTTYREDALAQEQRVDSPSFRRIRLVFEFSL